MNIVILGARRSVFVEEHGQTFMADNDGDSGEARAFRPLQASACTYRIAFGPHAGQKVVKVQSAMPRETGFKHGLCAEIPPLEFTRLLAALVTRPRPFMSPSWFKPAKGQQSVAKSRDL